MLGTLLLYLSIGVITSIGLLFVLYTVLVLYNHWKYSHLPSPKLPRLEMRILQTDQNRRSFYAGHLQDGWKMMKELNEKELPLISSIDYWSQQLDSLTYVVFFFHKPIVITTDPSLIKDIVMDSKHRKAERFVLSFESVFGSRFLGGGLLTVNNYDSWKPRRKLYDPAFNKTYLKTLAVAFNEIADEAINHMDGVAGPITQFPLRNYITIHTMNVISKVAFGTDFSEIWTADSLGITLPKDQFDVFIYIINTCFRGVNLNFQSAYPPLYKYLYPNKGKKYRQCVMALRKIGRDCILRRIKMIEEGKEVPHDILTNMLSSKTEETTIEDLVDDFCTFYVAGQETTGNSLMFTLILLWQHPNCMERVRKEIDEVLGERNTVTNEDLEQLVYLEQVIYESLRLYPPVVGLFKCLYKDVNFGRDMTIPANTDVLLAGAKTNRMDEYFDNPESFNPDRFSPDNKKPSSFFYFPFGLGHRACIGKYFALMEMKIILAKMLKRYKIRFPKDYKICVIQRTTLQPKDDLPCTLIVKGEESSDEEAI